MAGPSLVADSALTVVALALAVGATALAVALGAAALVVARKRPSAAEIRTLVREANAPLAQSVAELSRALEASGESAFLGPAARLEDILRETVAAARQVSGADAAAIVWQRNGEEPTVVTSGFDEAAERDPATLRLAGAETRSVVVTYRHANEVGGEAIHAALAVPLKTADGVSSGSLTVFWRTPRHEPTEDEIARVESLGARAAAASSRITGRATR